jgi:hypothetical protein
MRTTVTTEGILGLWRGNSATLLRVLPYAGLHFMTHEALEQHLRKHQEGQRLSPVNRFAAGAGAGFMSTLATYPLDVIRARMAVAATTTTPTYVKICPCSVCVLCVCVCVCVCVNGARHKSIAELIDQLNR